MTLHEFSIHEMEFSAYLLHFRNHLIVEPDSELLKGDYVLLVEIDLQTGEKTGKNIWFKIDEIDKSYEILGGAMYWKVDLKLPDDTELAKSKLKAVVSKSALEIDKP